MADKIYYCQKAESAIKLGIPDYLRGENDFETSTTMGFGLAYRNGLATRQSGVVLHRLKRERTIISFVLNAIHD